MLAKCHLQRNPYLERPYSIGEAICLEGKPSFQYVVLLAGLQLLLCPLEGLAQGGTNNVVMGCFKEKSQLILFSSS